MKMLKVFIFLPLTIVAAECNVFFNNNNSIKHNLAIGGILFEDNEGKIIFSLSKSFDSDKGAILKEFITSQNIGLKKLLWEGLVGVDSKTGRITSLKQTRFSGSKGKERGLVNCEYSNRNVKIFFTRQKIKSQEGFFWNEKECNDIRINFSFGDFFDQNNLESLLAKDFIMIFDKPEFSEFTSRSSIRDDKNVFPPIIRKFDKLLFY